MAWILKNSAGTKIERRDEPYLDAAMKAELEKDLMPRYPTRRAAALPVLHAVQNKHGWLAYQAIEEIAAFLEISASELLDTATFYEMFHLHPRGKHLIRVCQSISCELVGHQCLIDGIQKKLGIGPGETTDDGRFTLEAVECLGSCGTAPCALADETLHENLTPENLDRVLDSLK